MVHLFPRGWDLMCMDCFCMVGGFLFGEIYNVPILEPVMVVI